MPAPTLWNIPYQRNPFFTGREDVLSQLHRTLHVENIVALSHPQGISGLGGIGKTQTALEYAYRYHAEYNAVFWVHADSVTSLTSSLVELARVLELPERNEKDQEIIIQAVLRWLRLHPDWLLIYDNIDDLSIAEPFLPKAGPGHLLFTTRAHAFGALAQRLDIEKMEPDIGALLLLRRASLLALQATLNMANRDDQNVARAISEELGGLPLALDQAGAYIKEAPCPLLDYLPLYRSRRSYLLRERGSFDQGYPASVATTWSLSFEKVSQANPAAAELLDFCAFLAPDTIPEEMITGGAPHLGSQLQHIVIDPILFDHSIAALLAYSLIARNADEKMLSIHRLVQAVLRDTMTENETKLWTKQTVLAVSEASPTVEFAQWPACERCLPHALLVAQYIETEHIINEEAGRLLHKTATYLRERARYAEAEPLFQQALRIRKQQQGPEHTDVALSLHSLAILYNNLGKYAEAEPLFQRALHIYEQQLGPEHPDVAYPLNSLANIYSAQGKYAEAEPLFQRALHIREKQQGREHPDVAYPLSNLANLYLHQGKYAEAEPLFQRALRIREQQLGPDHPDVAYSLTGLAVLNDGQGKYAEAEKLHQRALHIWKKQLGPEHPNVAHPLNNLASCYADQGKYAEAEPLFQEALRIREQQLGPDHPDVAHPLSNLAELCFRQGKYTEAEPLFQRALRIREQQLGPDHPDVAYSLVGLANLCLRQDKYDEAEPLFQRALDICERRLGSEHPRTAIILNNIADLYYTQEQYELALPLFQRALAIFEQSLGPQHPNTKAVRHNYAALLRAMGRDEEAKQLEEQQ